MREFLATLAVVIIVAAVAFYAFGWLKFTQTDNDATIQIETKQIRNAADEAAERVVEKGSDLLRETKDDIRRLNDRRSTTTVAEPQEHVIVPDPVDEPAVPATPD
jgi:hypothetical protein